MEKLTALIFGAGQIGTFTARALVSSGVEVVAVDSHPAPGYLARFGPSTPIELIEMDFTDHDALRRLVQRIRPGVVVHCAGIVGEQCSRDPDLAWRVNVDGSRAIGVAALEAGVRHLVYLSSLSVYGRPAGESIREEAPLRPISLYGRTKAAAEDSLSGLRDRGLNVTVLRPCGVFGPLQLGKGSRSARFIERALLLAMRGKEVRIETTADAGDEFLYVKDLGRAIALTVTRGGGTATEVFNVGTGSITDAATLRAALIEAIPGAAVSVIHIEWETNNHVPPLDVTGIRNACGFTPEYGLCSAFTEYIVEAGLK